jgi:TetR/AcrR family transcriptional regulator
VAQGGRRDAILAAARTEFTRWGFAGARVDRIARVANVNKQLIFHYFHSKDGLYSATVSALFAEWQPVADDGASPSEHLRLVTAHLVRWLTENPGAARAVSEVAQVVGQPEDPAAPVAEWLDAAKGAVRAAIEGGQGLGHFRDDADPQAVAEIITSAAIGHALMLGDEGDTAPTATQRLIENISRAMVEYCAWR